MKFQHFRTVLSIVIFSVCLPQRLSAGTLYPLTYVDEGSSIAITDCNYSFKGNIVIPSVIDGKPVTAIRKNAFYIINGVKSISIPSSVTSIGESAFYLCRTLRSVNIPPGITKIEVGTFDSCGELATILIPPSVTHIGRGAFNACGKLDNVVIPAGVEEIGESAFTGCRLADLVIPENVKVIGDSAFLACDIQSLKIRSSGAKFGKRVFTGCLSLRAVDLPPGVREIPDAMFQGCSALTRLKIPSSVKRIGVSAFASTGLKSIDLSSSLTRIEMKAFQNCASLSMVTIPANVREIGDHAFGNYGTLMNALFLGDAPNMTKKAFPGVPDDFRVYFSPESSGFTIPKWHGFQSSLPKEEIEVQADGVILTDNESFRKLGSAIIGKTSGVTRFVIRNVGVRKLTGLLATISGENSSDFEVKMLTKSSLTPGQSALLDIVFQPKERGKRVSQLQLMSSDSNEDRFEIDLSGLGLQLIK